MWFYALCATYTHTQAADRSVHISVECWSNRSLWLFVAKYRTLRHSSYPHPYPCPSPCLCSFHFFCCNQLNKHKTRHTYWNSGGGEANVFKQIITAQHTKTFHSIQNLTYALEFQSQATLFVVVRVLRKRIPFSNVCALGNPTLNYLLLQLNFIEW